MFRRSRLDHLGTVNRPFKIVLNLLDILATIPNEKVDRRTRGGRSQRSILLVHRTHHQYHHHRAVFATLVLLLLLLLQRSPHPTVRCIRITAWIVAGRRSASSRSSQTQQRQRHDDVVPRTGSCHCNPRRLFLTPPAAPSTSPSSSAPSSSSFSSSSVPASTATTETASPSSSSSSTSILNKSPSNEYVLNVAFFSFLGFTVMQNVFAWAAHSHSMMADCAAMYVDVMTYLFNCLAERLKHLPSKPVHQSPHQEHDLKESESLLSESQHKQNNNNSATNTRLRELLLELIPPSISVVTLVVVTALALRDAWTSLRTIDPADTYPVDPNVQIMLLFSALNLMLDVVNVTCFARAHEFVAMIGLQPSQSQSQHEEEEREIEKEASSLLPHTSDNILPTGQQHQQPRRLNLNMCSAWTHICADTLRSIAVLLASGLAVLLPHAITPKQADAWGVMIVSFIILVSLVPLVQGLITPCGHIMLNNQCHLYGFDYCNDYKNSTTKGCITSS